MAKKTKLFEYESLQDKASVIAYLKALTEGLEQGEIQLADEEEKLALHPQNLMQLRIKGKQSHDSEELRIKLTWSSEQPSKIRQRPLSIKSRKKAKTGKSSSKKSNA
jgi:amphi-Trp domain-containing protein